MDIELLTTWAESAGLLGVARRPAKQTLVLKSLSISGLCSSRSADTLCARCADLHASVMPV